MSAETFVFTQLQSGALPTELSEVVPPTRLHYLTLIKPRNPVLVSPHGKAAGTTTEGRRQAHVPFGQPVESVEGWMAKPHYPRGGR